MGFEALEGRTDSPLDTWKINQCLTHGRCRRNIGKKERMDGGKN